MALGGTILSHKWACIFWLQLTAASPAAADLNGLCAKISAAWAANLAPQISADSILTSVAAVWTPTQGTEVVGSDGTSHPGTKGIAVQNAATCYCVSHHTGAYYRGGHSRSYIPGVPQNTLTNGSTISSADQANLSTGFTAFQTAVEAGATGGITAVQAGTVRFASKNQWLPVPVFNRWVSHTTRSTVGTQRGRLIE